MKPLVSIIMGSTSDMPVMKKAAAFLNEMEIPFEINAKSNKKYTRFYQKQLKHFIIFSSMSSTGSGWVSIIFMTLKAL